MKFHGTKGNDVIHGTVRDDLFLMGQGGNDIVIARGGDDVFNFGAAFTARDQINGGIGDDVLKLNGVYNGGHSVAFAPATMVNVEKIVLAGGHSYNLTTADAAVKVGKTLTVNANRLGHDDSLHFNGSAETNGDFALYGGKGDDILRGGGGNSNFYLGNGGNDTVFGGSGDNIFHFGGSLAAGDIIHGGGTTTLILNGDTDVTFEYSGGVRLIGWEGTMLLKGNHTYDLGMGASAAKLVGDLIVDGSAIGPSGHLGFGGRGGVVSTTLIGGAGDDTLQAGDNSGFRNDSPSVITGNGGADILVDQAEGNVTFVYNAASDSTSLGFDTIEGFKADADFFKLPGSPSIAVDTAINGGRLDSSTFDADIQNAVGAIANDHAVVFVPNTGDESNPSSGGVAFLVINIDGTAGYQAGSDFVMKMLDGALVHDSNFI